MKISECSYCGALAITDQDACESCRTALGISSPFALQSSAPTNIVESTPAVPANSVSNFPASNRAAFQQTPPIRNNFGTAPQNFPPPVLDSKCLRCAAPVARGQRQCFDCENGTGKSTFPAAKFGAALVIVIALVSGFYGYQYVRQFVGLKPAIFAKYEKVTGADDSMVFESFSISGDAEMVVTSASTQQILTNTVPRNNQSFEALTEKFAFSMLFKKPNKTVVEFTANDSTGKYTALKQAFDGVKGWKYTNIRNRNSRYEDAEDGFAEKKMGMGLEDYDSYEEVTLKDEKIVKEYGLPTLQYINGFSTFYVSEATMFSNKKTLILAKKKINGKNDDSLMFFDESTGFLLAIIKKTEVNNTTLISKIQIDNYKKFPVKRKGDSGTENKEVMLPTTWRIEMEPSEADQKISNRNVYITISLYIKDFKIDEPVSDSAFARP